MARRARVHRQTAGHRQEWRQWHRRHPGFGRRDLQPRAPDNIGCQFLTNSATGGSGGTGGTRRQRHLPGWQWREWRGRRPRRTEEPSTTWGRSALTNCTFAGNTASGGSGGQRRRQRATASFAGDAGSGAAGGCRFGRGHLQRGRVYRGLNCTFTANTAQSGKRQWRHEPFLRQRGQRTAWTGQSGWWHLCHGQCAL